MSAMSPWVCYSCYYNADYVIKGHLAVPSRLGDKVEGNLQNNAMITPQFNTDSEWVAVCKPVL